MKTNELIQSILNDPAASNWIKTALRDAVRRDIVDAVNDAEVLAKVLRAVEREQREFIQFCLDNGVTRFDLLPAPVQNELRRRWQHRRHRCPLLD